MHFRVFVVQANTICRRRGASVGGPLFVFKKNIADGFQEKQASKLELAVQVVAGPPGCVSHRHLVRTSRICADRIARSGTWSPSSIYRSTASTASTASGKAQRTMQDIKASVVVAQEEEKQMEVEKEEDKKAAQEEVRDR